jgi:hypothetical protein
MPYEINDKRYTVTRYSKAKDIFNNKILLIDKDTEIDSVRASWIIVDDIDNILFQGLTPEQALDMKVLLNYLVEV